MSKLIAISVKYVKQINQPIYLEAKPIITSIKYINNKNQKYFWAILESCLINEFIN